MKILIVSHMYPNNKDRILGSFIREQVKALKKLGYIDLLVISPVPYSPRFLWFRKKWRDYGEIDYEQTLDGVKVLYPRYICLPGYSLFFLQGISMALSLKLLLRKIIKNNEKIIIHCHTILPDGLAVAILKRFYPELRSICTIRGSDINIYPFKKKLNMFFTRFAIKRQEYITTVSQALKKKVTEIIPIDPNRIATFINGVDFNLFQPRGDNDTISIFADYDIPYDSDYKYVIFVGNLLKEKGIYELLEAFSIVNQTYPNLRLIYIGNGPENKSITKICDDHNLNDRVYFTGVVDHAKVGYLMKFSDIFVLPTYSEGMPNVMLEAMACGLPVIVSNVGGVSEILHHDENGLLIRPHNIKDIVTALNRLLENVELSKKIGSQAYMTIHNYSWEENVHKLETIYYNLYSI